MAKIEVKDLSLVFGNRKSSALKMLDEGASKNDILKKTGCTVAVSKANIDIYDGEIFVIMGLSGSGKSTLLRCFNQLIKPTTGSIFVNGEDVARMNKEQLVDLRRKEMSMVFQHFGLLPHRTVVSNVAFGLELQGEDKEQREEKAIQAIKTVGLEGYENMMTGELSGGMQQRVGLARALATNPAILLMDEAFSALDPLIRNQMQDELLEIQNKLKKTIVFITHDLDEALKIGDRIAIMKDGWIVQVGTPESILVEPADDYVKAFVENVDRSNIVTASSIMFKKFTRLHIQKDGPAVAIHNMRERGTNVLPVVDKDEKFKGFVKDDDMVELKKKNIRDLSEKLITEVPRISPDTHVSEILPLFIDHVLPVPVVNDQNELKGLVFHASIVAEVTKLEADEIYKIKDDSLKWNGLT